jgi:hypothetical protein
MEKRIAPSRFRQRAAKGDAERLPDEARAQLEQELDRHGRDEWAAQEVAELTRRERINWELKTAGRPLLPWP